jgi:hypothetical protein
LIVVIAFLGSASGVCAQDAGAEDGATEEEASPKKEREPFVKRDGQLPDNEQLGGEPSLSEPIAPSAPGESGSDETTADSGEPEGCDLDCIEAELAEEDERERRSKRTLDVARETESGSTEVSADSGDTLAAEPSTTTISETDVDIPEDRRLPTRLGPVRISVGKGNDWIGIGFATQLEFEYAQQFESAGFPSSSAETLEFRRIRFTLSSSFI